MDLFPIAGSVVYNEPLIYDIFFRGLKKVMIFKWKEVSGWNRMLGPVETFSFRVVLMQDIIS